MRIALECGLVYAVLGGAAVVLLPCAICLCCATLALARAVRGRPKWRFLPACRACKLELLQALCDEHAIESSWVPVPDPAGGAGGPLSVHVARLRRRGATEAKTWAEQTYLRQWVCGLLPHLLMNDELTTN